MKLIRHRWKKHIGFRSFKCGRCGIIRKYDPGFAKSVYFDRSGKLSLVAPTCVLPNIKL
jgi:hypothetical protein